MLQRRHLIALSAAVLLVIVLLNLPQRTTSQLKVFLGGAFLPLFGLASSSQSLSDRTLQEVVPRSVLIDRIERLEYENAHLKLQLMQTNQIWRENRQLREALNWATRMPWKGKLGRVLLRDPANWWRSVTIDLGSRDGVTADMTVLTEAGLVGKINQVSFATSQVLLVGDPNCRVSVIVTDEAGREQAAGLLAAGSASILDPSLVQLSFLSGQSQVAPGQIVVTSGLGGVFPRDVTVGRIADTRNVGYGLYTEARVKLAADLARLDKVWVLFP